MGGVSAGLVLRSRPRALWTLGASSEQRLREREGLFIGVRWVIAACGVLAVAADGGRHPGLVWLAPLLVGLVNVVAALGRRRLRTVRSLTALGVAVTATDGLVALGAMFNYADNADSATGLLLVLVVLEAALRWGVAGGLTVGALAAAATTGWMLHRDATAVVEFRVSTAGARAGVLLLAGLLLGVVVKHLDLAGREVREGFRRTEAVSRFALEAPRLTVGEAARQLARILHEDLDLERTAIVTVPDDRPDVFRLVATAGYDEDTVSGYRTISNDLGILGRCLRTGRAQLQPEVTEDPDYLEVDPATRSEMAVPMRSGDAIFGVIDVAATRPHAFTEEDLRFLETAAAQLARAFENTRLAEMERQTIAELERLSAFKDDFIAIANHELRTPVTTIAGFAASLVDQRDELTPEEVDDAIERIARQSAHLKRLIEDLLTVPDEGSARQSVATPAGEPTAVELARMLRDVADELAPDDGRHQIVVDVPTELLARGRPDAVRRVLANLVNNAVRYSPDGGPVILRARAGDECEAGEREAGERRGEGHREGHRDPERSQGMVRVEIEDRGMGIDPADVPTLFTKFGRLGGPDARGGMGLGLFIVKELVEEMGGSVGVESEAGVGSRFWFSLPEAPLDATAS